MVDATFSYSVIPDRREDALQLRERLSVPPIDQIDVTLGWPPRILGATNARMVDSVSSESYFTVHDQRRSLQVALAHPEVRDLLNGRWEVLGCDLVRERGTSTQERHRARVCLFNYTTNRLIETYVADGCVLSVALRAPHEYPEAPIEMAQAIALARAHPQLQDEVRDLAAHAILQVPHDPHGPSYGHRCIWVMFTDQADRHRESPVRYSAMVDLRLQTVLAAGPTPCSADSPDRPAHTE
jgi:hypothetical protein